MTTPDAPQVVAVHQLARQRRPVVVTSARPFEDVACEALAEADRLLARSASLLAVAVGSSSVAPIANNLEK